MHQRIRQWALLIIVGGGLFALDQWIKQRVLSDLVYGEPWKPIAAVADFIWISLSYNTGAAFGIFPAASDFFLALAFMTVAAFLVFYPRLPSHAWLSRLSIALISGGALSNAVDRLIHGHVIDYVHVQVTPTISNISNMADHAITVGVVLLLIDQWRAEQAEQRAAEQAALEQAELDAEALIAPSSLDTPEAPLPSSVDEPSEGQPGGRLIAPPGT